jgi:TetR/AcrR family transcriptional regulator, copper-responsive repressor
MGRPKGFSREEVLLKAIAVFWEQGFAQTTLQDLEHATGVNKSGLYTEFKNKEDIFIESLRYYLETRGGDDILSSEPKGWNNIERFLEIGQTCYTGIRGCFSVNSMRDAAMLPPEAQELIARSTARQKKLIVCNIKAVSSASNPDALADMILTFFSGLCIEENLHPSNSSAARRVASLMTFLRQSK